MPFMTSKIESSGEAIGVGPAGRFPPTIKLEANFFRADRSFVISLPRRRSLLGAGIEISDSEEETL
jgi:hypothetical protein